jgi:hypothetical protein
MRAKPPHGIGPPISSAIVVKYTGMGLPDAATCAECCKGYGDTA